MSIHSSFSYIDSTDTTPISTPISTPITPTPTLMNYDSLDLPFSF